MNIKELEIKLRNCWCAETAKGEWNSLIPCMNQCAITALIVQDIFGGELLRCEMTNGDSHYWNKLPDGTEIDLTKEQFDYIDGKPLKDTTIIRSRDYVLSFPDTIRRYKKLLEKIQEC